MLPTAVALQTMMVDVGDGMLATLIAGAGTGRDVVMLHGWTLDHRNWQTQLPMADHLRLIMPDRRGFGSSTAPPDLAREWQDIDRLAGDDPFVLVGLSQGASVALDFARRRPDRLAALVLVGAPLHGLVPHDDADDVIPRGRYARLVAADQLATMKAEWAAHPLVAVEPAASTLLRAMLDCYDGRDLIVEPSTITLSRADIAALAMPVLAIAGAKDTGWRRRVAQFIAATAPMGNLVVIDGAGHLCNLDNPAAFNAFLSDFLAVILH